MKQVISDLFPCVARCSQLACLAALLSAQTGFAGGKPTDSLPRQRLVKKSSTDSDERFARRRASEAACSDDSIPPGDIAEEADRVSPYRSMLTLEERLERARRAFRPTTPDTRTTLHYAALAAPILHGAGYALGVLPIPLTAAHLLCSFVMLCAIPR